MTTYDASSLTNTQISHKKGVTVQQGRAGMRDNLLACMETDPTAPINQAVWHPYDGGTGVFYDSTVDGSVASVQTPTLSPRYEYKIECFNIGHDAGTKSISVSWYVAGPTLFATEASPDAVSAGVTLPRHYFRMYAGDGYASISTGSVTAARAKIIHGVVFWPTSNLDEGQLRLLRRADYSFR